MDAAARPAEVVEVFIFLSFPLTRMWILFLWGGEKDRSPTSFWSLYRLILPSVGLKSPPDRMIPFPFSARHLYVPRRPSSPRISSVLR